MVTRRQFLVGAGAAAAVLGARRSSASQAFTFAVVPQYDQRHLFAIWKPIIADLQARTGINLKLVATLTVPEFERDFARGIFDFAYVNPLHFVVEQHRLGYLPLVRDVESLRGVLVVRIDSPVTSPGQLAGKSLAVPSLNALGPLVVRSAITRGFGVEPKVVNVRTHTAVYTMVANGQVDAGAGVEKTLRRHEAPVVDQLRVIHRTADLPAHPVVAHPRVPTEVREAVRAALLAMSGSPSSQALLAQVPIARLVTASAEDYQSIEDLGGLWTAARE